MVNLPNSWEEKRSVKAVTLKDGTLSFPHWVFVHELRSLLENLRDGDWVTPSKTGDLLVQREKKGIIGFINFHHTSLELYIEEDE